MASIVSGNGFSPICCQAITQTNTDLLLIGPLVSIFSEILTQNKKFFINGNAFENVICEMVGILSRERWVDKAVHNPWDIIYKVMHFESYKVFNTLRPRQHGHHFPNHIFKWIFFNENVWISIKISLKFVPKGPINNIPALVQIMAWHRPGDKPLSEPIMV